MSAGSGDALKFSGNERGAVFNGRGSWRGRISGALIQGVLGMLGKLGISIPNIAIFLSEFSLDSPACEIGLVKTPLST